MIPLKPHQDRQNAFYSEDGNIVIPGGLEQTQAQTKREDSILTSSEIEGVPWMLVEEPTKGKKKETEHVKHARETVSAVLVHAREHASNLLHESSQQYKVSAEEAEAILAGTFRGMKGIGGRLKEFLYQPVWIVKKNKAPKKYSRLSLFMFDTVRFGGTFAAIFLGLFFSLNYQSFWQMVEANLDPLQSSEALAALETGVENSLKEKLMGSPSLAVAGAEQGNLLSYLPEVGPPENRLIIPKLNLNVPLVTPSYESLLREDWENVETDIQNALQQGVVHYPGTARPGQAGNFFVTGHSSYYPWAPGQYKSVFARLHDLNIGDEYWIYYGGDKHRYVVTGEKEVKPSDVTVLDQPVDQRIATLMTCTPVGTTLRRLILTAQEIDITTGEPMAVGEQESRPAQKLQLEALPI